MKIKKALVVDDSQNVAQVLASQLSALGVENVELASDGVEASEKIKDAKSRGEAYSVIFCDHQMPNKSGIELFRELKGEGAGETLPFILVTASGEDKLSLLQFVSEGITDFLIKPVNKDLLREKLEKVFAS